MPGLQVATSAGGLLYHGQACNLLSVICRPSSVVLQGPGYGQVRYRCLHSQGMPLRAPIAAAVGEEATEEAR